MADDRLAAELAAIRERSDKATPGPWSLTTDSDGDEYHYYGTWPYAIRMPVPHAGHASGELHDYDFEYSELAEFTMPTAEFLVHAREDVPRLLAAVEAVLEMHAPADDGYSGVRCEACSDEIYVPFADCPERRRISRALLGEDGTDG